VIKYPALLLPLAVLALVNTGGCRRSADEQRQQTAAIAVTSSYLEVATRDLLEQDVNIYQLAGPGMCPGHFDLSPSQLADLRQSRLLLRFDFQKGLDRKLSEMSDDGLQIIGVSPAGGLCEPESYLSACRQVGPVLVKIGLLEESSLESRLEMISSRLLQLEQWKEQRIKENGLKDKPVITSRHQAAFCHWLGLNVVGTYSSTDATSAGEIDQAVSAGQEATIQLVIANRPEGRRLADRLADRLNAEVIMFNNFPTKPAQAHAFNHLVRSNVQRLVQGTTDE
jgi:ABC-type Zn uptake system ZnuABC Zn-binding protein ZnuA